MAGDSGTDSKVWMREEGSCFENQEEIQDQREIQDQKEIQDQRKQEHLLTIWNSTPDGRGLRGFLVLKFC